MKKTLVVAIAAVSLSFSAAACSKKKKKETPPPPGAETTDPAKDPAAGKGTTTQATPTMMAGAGADALVHLPDDVKGVIGISIKGLQKSKYAPMLKEMMLKSDQSGHFQSFVKSCGFDPFEKMDSIVIGVRSFDKGNEQGAIVMKGAYGDEAALTGCAIKEAEKQGDKINVLEHNGKKIYEPAKDPGHAATFVAADTILVGQVGWLKTVIDGSAKNAKGGPIAAHIAKIDTTKAVWFALPELPTAGMGGPMAMMSSKPKGFWGTLDFTGGLAANMQFQMASADDAQKLAGMAAQGAGMLKAFTTKMDMAATGDVFKIDVAMTDQQLEMAIDLAKSMAQRFGGRMGAGGGMGMPPMPTPPGGP